jgi:hypothetical protein
MIGLNMKKRSEGYENVEALRGYYSHLFFRQQNKNITAEEEEVFSFFDIHLRQYPELRAIILHGIRLTAYVKANISAYNTLNGRTYKRILKPVFLASEKLCMEIFKKEREVYEE